MGDSEIPPLEEVEHIMERLKMGENAKHSTKLETNKVSSSDTKFSNSKSSPSSLSSSSLSTSSSKISSSSEFGGMKKGFLFGGSSKPKAQVKENSSKGKEKTLNHDIPLIKSSEKKSNLVFSEVQEAMAADTKGYKHFQEDLETRISSNPKVTDVLSDPAWLPILEEFQKDPVKAMNKYKDDAEIRNTMQELCKAFGDSFLHMQPSEVSEEEKLVSDIMETSEIKEALTDRLIMQMMVYMKEGSNEKVHRCMQGASQEQKRKIQLLVDHGLFAFAG